MSRPWWPFALLGGVVAGGFYWLGRSKSKAETPQLPPPGPPQPTPQQVEIQRLAVQAAEATQKAQALETQVANLTVSAAKAPPAQKKAFEEAAAKLVIAAANNEQQAKALKAQVVVKAQAEQAAKKVAESKAAKGPMYPVGLDVRFGKRQATITEAHQDAQGNWHYTANVNSGEWRNMGGGIKQFSETAVREAVQKEVGPLQPGQAFTAGVSVYRNGQGGRISKAEKNASGDWIYTLDGWGNPVSSRELMGILTR